MAAPTERRRESDPIYPPYSIVWSPLHPITCLFPFIGHTGITDSRGVASDFQGTYSVGDRGRMAFGRATRFFPLDRGGEVPGGAEEWDRNIEDANAEYRKRFHNIFCDNCHSHVANALNRVVPAQGDGFIWRILGKKFNMVNIAILMFFQGRFFSFGGALHQVIPMMIIILFFFLI
uniref:Transmembrane protein 222 n=1 Tax=Corethron hystrix TaxID=216773 RepID=A0A7S1BJ49_9STRA